MKLLARSSLKKPFVKTVATVAMIGGAAAAGCSGNSADTDPKPSSSSCPETKPTTDGACNLPASQSCGYDDCYGTPSTTAKCKDGKWLVGSASCNPPAPTSCPATKPDADSVCDLSAEQTCEYDDCYGTPGTTAKCENWKWKLATIACNPPAPQCPADKPQDGTPCSLPSGTRCNNPDYKNYCGKPVGPGDPVDPSRDPLQVTCKDGTWEVLEVDYGPCGCPPDKPQQGEYCYSNVIPDSCTYDACDGGAPAITAKCVGNTWNVSTTSCNP